MEAGINPTLIILAGGKSTRMGEDKALMFDNTSRIQKIAENLGVKDCIILCGNKNRKELFQGNVWADPISVDGILDTIIWISKYDADVCFACVRVFRQNETKVNQ